MAEYDLDMLVNMGGEQKRTAMISARALTDTINEDNKWGEATYQKDIEIFPEGRADCLGIKRWGTTEESLRRHRNTDKEQTTLFFSAESEQLVNAASF